MQKLIRIPSLSLRARLLSLTLLPLLMFASVSSALAQTTGQQIRITQVDKSRFPQVTVYVSVVNENGEPVGIDPGTIQIIENEQVMQPTEIRGGGTTQTIPVTTMLVMDISGSMEKNGKLDAAKEAAKSYVSQLRPGDQAGLMTYDTQVYYVQPITGDTAALSTAIDGLQPGSDTAMYNALVEAEKNLESISGRKSIIVLSDGLDNKSQAAADDVIAGVSSGGLTISTIGFGDAASREQVGLDEAGLKSLAEQTGGLYAYAGDAQSLSAIFQQYGDVLQSEYAITYLSPTSLRDGVNRGLTVSLSGGAAVASTSARYNPGGLLPEVTAQSWSMFGAILAVLLLLLALPFLANYGMNAYNAVRARAPKKSRVKFNNEQAPASPTKGRVKMK
jgi:Ca-activated chloride channel family protein